MACAGAFAIGGVLLWLLGANPFEAYWVLLNGAFGSVSGFGAATLTKMTPLLLVALGICISFRGGVINIGGEGQIIVGALAPTAFALWLRDVAGWLLLPLTLLVGALAARPGAASPACSRRGSTSTRSSARSCSTPLPCS
jgi:ABC-type uncharacterized transport system permease subunit